MSEFHGQLRLKAQVDAAGKTVLAEQAFRAPFHVGKTYWDGATLRVQVVNPTAGILAGDLLESDIEVGAGAALLVTTPSASRVFTMREGEALARQSFRVRAGGWLEFLPEALVPHQDSNYRQTTEIEVEEGGALVFADVLMPGRMARGETWAWGRLRLELSVRIAGRLILRERLDQSGAEMRGLAALAKAEAGACFANVILAAPALREEGEWSRELRALHAEGVWVGLSRLRHESAWSLKIVAQDNIALRRIMARLREILAERLPGMRTDLRRV